MRKHYDIDISKKFFEDLTKITKLQFLYSCSISLHIVELEYLKNPTLQKFPFTI